MEQTVQNLRRKPRQFKVGSIVKLYKKPRAKKTAKLWRTWEGPYKVIKVADSKVNFTLKHVASQELLENQNVKDVGPYYEKTGTAVPATERKKPAESRKSYVVARVVGDRGTHGRDKQYKIQWEGFLGEDTWEPEANLDCPKLVQDYHRRQARAPPQATVGSASRKTLQTVAFRPTPWAVTLKMDLTKIKPEDLTRELCSRAGIRVEQITAQFAFVPCETYSVAGYSNRSRGNHYREHDDPGKKPRQDDGSKARLARTHDKLVANILRAWKIDNSRGSSQHCFMENPVGFLAQRPFMKKYSELLDMRRHVVHYCAYNHRFKKPTHIWTSSGWEPRGGAAQDGLCHGRCKHGEWKNNHYKHYYGLAQEPIRGPRGPGATKLKNAVPEELCAEWIRFLASTSPGVAEGGCIIDLCAGFQSLKPIALQYGFNYIGVDIAGDRSA